MMIIKYLIQKKTYLFLFLFTITFFSCGSNTDVIVKTETEQETEQEPVDNLGSGLRVSGKKIVDGTDNEIFLRGVNLGQWLLMEGFMSGSNGGMSQSAMKRKLFESGKSRQEIESYFKQYRDNFITRADIDFIAEQGFNVIRMPLHYELFLTHEQLDKRLDVVYSDGAQKEAAYNTYKGFLQTWVDDNTLAIEDDIDGFKVIDDLVAWCKANEIYIILDMHAVPGTVGDNTAITDEMMEDFSFGGRDFFYDSKNREALYTIWDKISERYKNENTITMYDLINEPHHRPSGSLEDMTVGEMSQLRNSYNTIINRIRENDDDTMIMLQGGDFGNDYLSSGVSIYPSDLENKTNIVYNLHRYRANNSKTAVNNDTDNLSLFGSAVAFRDTHNVPLFCGETGLDNDYTRLKGNYDAMKDLGIGWTFWSFKTHTDRNDPQYDSNRIPLDVGGNNLWDDLQQWEDGTLFSNVRFENCEQNPIPEFWSAIDPN